MKDKKGDVIRLHDRTSHVFKNSLWLLDNDTFTYDVGNNMSLRSLCHKTLSKQTIGQLGCKKYLT